MSSTDVSLRTDKASLRVLMIEDDALLRDHVLAPQLRRFGFEVAAVGDVAASILYTQIHWPEILILDVGLPDADGFELIGRIRAQLGDVGIVMLTGRHTTADRVRGLTEGADAYLTKPVDVDLLAATLYSLARRLRSSLPAAPGRWRLDADGWCLLAPSGDVVALTRTEGRLLSKLFEKPNQAVSRGELIAVLTTKVYDFDPHRLDTLVHRLRKKVQSVLHTRLPLNSVHGEGYVFLQI